ncbi:cellulose biosynthesis cyclic di-GMP-binding regulatory protein BcsB [Paenibacillus soyae]|uniref:Cellulose biosynthesis cyclic di-GMP-binding regulatory protein BcsB n=1 Tax=Paenibacillus soyae TaxID=2969249 RepID=A0A9X2SC29_9BACL|nr:cellulose biosynthesis cyclic di-GMP-binding regulatory protein BcsB [Paenibacillus soyae]
MKKRTAAWLIGWVAAAMLVLILPGERAGAERFPIILSQEDWSLSGSYASSQSGFQIPDYWQVKQATLSLNYEATALARQETSSVTLLLNGTPFYSFRPPADGQKRYNVQVAVPTDLLRSGSNTLTVQGGIRTAEEERLCAEEDRQDNWLRLFATTSLQIDYEPRPLDGTIRDFAARFGGLDVVQDRMNAVVIPENGGSAELEAAAYAVAGFAKASTLQEEPIELLSLSDPRWLSRAVTVVVALREHLPAELDALLEKRDWSREAALQLAQTNGRHVLIVTGDDPVLLAKAGRLLGNQELVSQLGRSLAIVTADTNVDTPEVQVSRNELLTAGGVRIDGPRHQERSFFISLPANRAIAEASKVRLDFRYAKNLDFNRSLVTILIDGKPIGSKRLSEELADADTLTLPIPKNLNISGNFMITAAFDLEVEGDYCLPDNGQTPWAYIAETSMLQLNTKDNTDLLFENYPYPFLRDGLFHKVAVVLPIEERGGDIYAAVGYLFSLLGQYADSNAGEVRFFFDDEPAETWRDRNVIAIGSFKQHALIRSVNESLFFRYDTEGRAFVSNEKRSLDPEYGARLGSLQLIASPYEAGHALLAVTGPDTGGIRQVSRLIASEAERWKVWGDAVLVDRDGIVNSYRFKEQAEAVPERTLESVFSRSDMLRFLTAAALILVLVLLSLLLMARKYRKKRGGQGEA